MNVCEDIFAGSGEMAALMRNFDWQSTPLGVVENWPQSLRTAVSILLNSPYPIFICWGSEFIKLYNDSYIPLLGEKHPQALGQPLAEVCPELWSAMGSMLQEVWETGKPTFLEDMQLFMRRNSYLEEMYMTFSYGLIRDESTQVGGIFVACTETTQNVIGQRRLRTLRDLAAKVSEAKTAEDACCLAGKTLSANSEDIPFSLIYLLNHDSQQAKLVATSGCAMDIAATPLVINLNQQERGEISADPNRMQISAFKQVIASGEVVEVRQLDCLINLSAGCWPEPPHTALVLPIAQMGKLSPVGLLVVGVSSRLSLNEDYRSFFDLVAGQIAAAIANARAFEAENQRAAALAELDRAKGAFFSNVSHEFSTPLTIMLSPFSELIATSDEKLSLREQQTWEVAKQQVSNILETISDGFIAFDRDWRFTYINQEAAKLLQKSPEELQGLTLWEDVFQCSIGSTFERELRRAVAEQVTIKFEKFLPQRNIWLAVRAYPSSAGVCIYLCDITEAKRNDMLRRENEQRLQESQRLLQQITDTIPGILYIYDLVENRNVYVNQQISALLGYTAEQIEAMGETLFPQLVHPEDLAKFPDHIQRFHSLPDGEVLESEYRMRSLDGEWYWFSGREIVFNRNTDGSARQVLGTAYDITKRKQAEADLRLQTERFELAAAAVNCLIYDWNIETDLVERTDGLTRIFGYLPEEAEPTRDWWTRLIHPEDLTSAKEQLFAQLANQNRYKVEYRVRCKNNQYLYVIDQGFVIKDSAGNPIRVVGTTTDISEYKQLEVALQHSQAKLNDILNSANAAIISYRLFADNSWEYEYFSAGCEKVFGFTVAELTENPHLWMSRILPEDLAILLPKRYQDIFACRNSSIQYRFQHKDGTWRWISDIMTSRYETEFNCWIVTAVAADITERNQLLTDVQQRASQLRGLTEASLAMNSLLSIEQVLQVVTEQARVIIGAHQSITTMAIDGNYTKPIYTVSFSDKYAQWQDYKPKFDICKIYPQIYQMNQALRMTQNELISDPKWIKLNQEIENNLPMRGLLVAPLIRRDGVNIGVIQLSDKHSSDFTAADADILVQLAQMASVAIENSRLYEAEQNARTQAESANRIKDEFLAVLSHELRSPLNPILGWAKLLRSRKFDQNTTERALETIERNAKLQTELIEDLLDVSRILQGKLTLNVYPVDLKSIIEAAMETVHLAAQAKSIKIEALFQPNVSLIPGDPNRLQQVIWNLLSNAVKFTPNGGRVEIELEQIGGFILIRVSDTGKGIQHDFLPYIFDYFRQENSTTTRKFGGLGLGLAIVRNLVELHGGIVQAESPGEGKGAIFTVQLPVKTTSLETKLEIKNSDFKTDLNGVRALVVEDQTDTRELIVTLLEEASARVIPAASAQEALEVLAQSEIDILLSDIGMPEIDGYMLVRQIRNHPSEKISQIPAIALTAYVGEINHQQALNAGFQKHLAKPVEPVELITVVANLVNNS